MTKFAPKYILVDLYFSKPLLVSQGNVRDNAHVWMRQDIFMLKDEAGLWKSWKDNDIYKGNRSDEVNAAENREIRK